MLELLPLLKFNTYNDLYYNNILPEHPPHFHGIIKFACLIKFVRFQSIISLFGLWFEYRLDYLFLITYKQKYTTDKTGETNAYNSDYVIYVNLNFNPEIKRNKELL